jgi:hypothetical protein
MECFSTYIVIGFFQYCSNFFDKLMVIRRKGGVIPAGGDTEDPLGLDVEGEAGFPEDQLQVS